MTAPSDDPSAEASRRLGRKVRRAERLGGGEIAAVWRLMLEDGGRVVAKKGPGLRVEAAGLAALAPYLPTPRVLAVDEDLLLLEWIDGRPGALDEDAERHLGALVAGLHDVTAARFGYGHATLIGGLVQPNEPSEDWVAFFRDRRLLHMAEEASRAGRLPAALRHRIDRLAGRLDRHVDGSVRPSLVHGDLWGGNILGRDGRVRAVIDPALYHADPEIELAFMTLFDSVGATFFAAYGERRPMRPGFFEVRRDLYNLYPLLVHVRLFGASYLPPLAQRLAALGC